MRTHCPLVEIVKTCLESQMVILTPTPLITRIVNIFLCKATRHISVLPLFFQPRSLVICSPHKTEPLGAEVRLGCSPAQAPLATLE